MAVDNPGKSAKNAGVLAVRPTVIDVPARVKRPSARPPKAVNPSKDKPAAPSSPASSVFRPTEIPGVKRQRLQVDGRELRAVFPFANAATLKQASKLLEAVALESLGERSAILWGHAEQQEYSDLLSRGLALSQQDHLLKAAGYVGRMTTILSSIDLQAALSSPDEGMATRYLKRLNGRIDSAGELSAAQTELDQLVQLMGAAINPLLDLKQELQKLSRRSEEIADELDASSLAAEFLAKQLRADQTSLASLFTERSMSLAKTVLQIRESGGLREAQTSQPLQLIAAIQDVVLVTMPAFLTSLAAMIATSQNRQPPTPTVIGELGYQLRNIVQQLNSKGF